MVSHSKFIKDDSFPMIDKCVKSYLNFLRTKFPDESIPLKLHIMEDHMLDMMKSYRFGMGLFGEQGVESIHHKIKDIATRFRHMPNAEQRLQSCIEEHHLHTMPQIRQMVPDPKQKHQKKL